MLKKLFLLVFISGALVLSGCSSSSNVNKGDDSLSNIKDSGIISTSESLTHNWGSINIKGGYVSKTFKFKNNDSQNLILKGASTSCMCTSAAIGLPDGTQSPTFGMHNNPTKWAYSIGPGEEFSMKVVFDPMAHGPDSVGPINRSVFLVTSSKGAADIAELSSKETRGRVTELRVKGNVLSEAKFNEKNSS